MSCAFKDIPIKALAMVILSHILSRTSRPDSGQAMALATVAMSLWMERWKSSNPGKHQRTCIHVTSGAEQHTHFKDEVVWVFMFNTTDPVVRTKKYQNVMAHSFGFRQTNRTTISYYQNNSKVCLKWYLVSCGLDCNSTPILSQSWIRLDKAASLFELDYNRVGLDKTPTKTRS